MMTDTDRQACSIAQDFVARLVPRLVHRRAKCKMKLENLPSLTMTITGTFDFYAQARFRLHRIGIHVLLMHRIMIHFFFSCVCFFFP